MVKNPPTNVGDIRDASLTSGWGGAPGRGHSNPLQYSCLENTMDRRARRAIVHGAAKSPTQLKQFTMHASKCAKWPQSCLTLCNHMDCSLPILCPWDSPDKNTGVGCCALLQGIFSTQGANPGLLHCRWILYRMGHQGRQ